MMLPPAGTHVAKPLVGRTGDDAGRVVACCREGESLCAVRAEAGTDGVESGGRP